MNSKDKEILMDAVVGGTLKDIENAFKEHNLVFDYSYFDYKLLQAGLQRNNHSIQNFLINKIGCRVGNPNRDKLEETPLHLVMKLNSEYIIKKMLSKGAFIFHKDSNGDIPLLAGFKNKHFVSVRALLTHSKLTCKPEKKNFILYFHIACATNHIPAAKSMLQDGVNPNNYLCFDSEEYSGLNPVLLAAEQNYHELFQLLVCHGADLSIKNPKGLTPLHIVYYTSSAEHRKSRIEQIFENGNKTKFVNSVDSNRVSHFLLCCMCNEPNFVQIFIDSGVNVNSSISLKSTNDTGFTPLHFAVVNGCERTVALLLKSGADCNKKDAEGRTPIHFAHKLGYWKEHIFKMLLDYKASSNIADNQGYTPLHMEFCYANSENKNIIDMLFSKISGKINYTNEEGLSHFHIACTRNNTSRIKEFLDSGVDVNSCVSLGIYGGYTALHLAVLYNQKDVVKLLIKKNAQVNLKTKEFQVTPLHLACEFNYAKFCGENPTSTLNNFKAFPINLASSSNYYNQLDIINLLLSHGADVNAKDYQGVTPLFRVFMIEKSYCKLKWSYNCQEHLSRLEREGLIKEINIRLREIIEILLDHNANATACLNKQETILHIISKNNSLKIPENKIKLILTKGVNIDAVDDAGLTALHLALTVGNKRMARILLRLKANVNIKCENSKIALHTVFKKVLRDISERDIFSALLENGSDVNIIGGKGRVLLYDAINCHDDFTIEKLLHYGADINMEDSMGVSCVSPLYDWEDESPHTYYYYEYGRIFEIIYIHVQKLLALGLHVSNKVQKCCSQLYPRHKSALFDNAILSDLNDIFHDCTKELERMKLIKMDNYTTLYSILVKDPHELAKHVKNKNLIKTTRSRNLNTDFPFYSYLLKLQFKRGLIRSDLVQSAKTSLINVITVDLPDLCLDLIIKFLKNEDVANLNVAAPLKRALKRKLNYDETPREKRMHLRNCS